MKQKNETTLEIVGFIHVSLYSTLCLACRLSIMALLGTSYKLLMARIS
jgi:hypothetical protein